MIRFFNVNNPSVAVFLFLFAIVLNAVVFVEPALYTLPQTNAPFSRLFFSLTEFLFGNNRYILAILSIILVVVQALMLNSLVNNAKLFERGTFVTAIIYLLCVSLFREFLFLSPALLSIAFIIPALGKTLRFFRQQRCYTEVFDMGFLIGIASLFYKPAFLLIILLFVGLAVMRSFNWREWVIGLFGFLTIYFLTGTCLFMVDNLDSFVQSHIVTETPAAANRSQTGLSLSVVIGYTGVLATGGALIFLFNFLKSPVQARKFLLLMGWAALLLALSSLFVSRVSLQHFVLLSVPLSIVICYLFMNIRRVKIADWAYHFWLAAVLFFQYFKT